MSTLSRHNDGNTLVLQPLAADGARLWARPWGSTITEPDWEHVASAITHPRHGGRGWTVEGTEATAAYWLVRDHRDLYGLYCIGERRWLVRDAEEYADAIH